MERDNLGTALVPIALHRKWIVLVTQKSAVLSGIDLDLQFQSCLRIGFWREFVNQMRGMTGVLGAAFTKPGQRFANGIHGRADGLCIRLHQVDVL